MTRSVGLSLSLAITAAVLATGDVPVAGGGKLKSETRSVAEFDAIQVNISADVTIAIGEQGRLFVEGEETILRLIETAVEDGTLRITASKQFSTTKPIKIFGTAANISNIAVNGSGDVSVEGLDNDRVGIKVRGSAYVVVTGKTTQLGVNLSGSGDVKGYDLVAVSASVTVKGSGDVEVRAAETLSAKIIRSGDCKYRGSPTATASVIGSGDIGKTGD